MQLQTRAVGRSWTRAVQIRFRQIRGIRYWRKSQALRGVEANRAALLSQEGSTIETAVEIVRGVVPEPCFLRMHFETLRLGNHPSRHRKERDNAALLTQEGNSAHSRLPISLCGKSIREAVAKRGFGFQKRPRVILDRSSPGLPIQGRMEPYELCS